MHWIQRRILLTLSTNDRLRYSQLKPTDVEGNLFMYHLAQLTAARLIDKDVKSYGLTTKGKTFVTSLNMSEGTQISQPRVLVALLCRYNGEFVLYRWSRQPYRARVSLPFGRAHTGWTLFEVAAEQLHYKLNVPGDNYRMRGSADIIVKAGAETTDHYLVHVVEVAINDPKVSADGLTGQPFLAKLQDLPEQDFVPGFYQIMRFVQKHEGLFFEEVMIHS